MDELQAKSIAEVFGGQPWQSGGGIWLVIKEREDKSLVVFSDETICEYKSEEDLHDSKPFNSIMLL